MYTHSHNKKRNRVDQDRPAALETDTFPPPLRVIYIQEEKRIPLAFFYLTVTCIGFLYIIYMHEVIVF